MARFLANLRLRTKFLLSMVLVIAGLTLVALLVVRKNVQERAHQELATSAKNSLVMFEILQHQRQAMLSRKADLLATSAFFPMGTPVLSLTLRAIPSILRAAT